MEIVNPIQIHQDHIESYNVPMLTPAYDPSTEYSKGDIVTADDCGSIRYESMINNNIGNDPKTSPLEWVELSMPANCFAMFDTAIGTQTKGDLSIDNGDVKIKINVDTNLSGFGFLNVTNVNEIYVKVVDSFYGTVYETTFEMNEKAIDGWYDWYFGGFEELNSFIETDINMPISGTFEVEFRSIPDQIAKVGEFIYGSLFEVGTSLYGIGWDLKDFSRVEENEFGDLTVVRRATSNLSLIHI